jgi:hypothetical protein
MSGEHFLSRALMRLVEADDGGVFVSGFSWQKDPAQRERFGINSLVANVLCRKHNSQLSDLDSEALSLVRLIERSNAKEAGFFLDTIDGDLLERYLLKVLCGVLASTGVRHTTGEANSL